MGIAGSFPIGKTIGGLSSFEPNSRRFGINIRFATNPNSDQRASHPLGYRNRTAIWQPIKDGGIAAVLRGSSSISADLSGTGTIEATLSGASSVNFSANEGHQIAANLSGVGSLQAPLTGAGKIECIINIGSQPSAEDIAQAVMASIVESGLDLRKTLRLVTSVLAGKVSGAGTATITMRNAVEDSKDRVVADVDTNGNRTSITYDLD